jgi:hypothetical protein
MKKDPAVLLYFRDFLVSTDLMSNEEVGAHIRILCHQADKGHLHESTIRERICGSIWDTLKARYKQDENGLWYHQRMEKVLNDRKDYVKSRLSNLDGNPTREPHMGASPFPSPSPIPLASPSPKVRGVFTPPTLEEVKAYCKERNNSIDTEKFIAYYESNGWRVGRNPMKDWRAAIRTWERGSVASIASRFEKPKLTKELLISQAEAIRGF